MKKIVKIVLITVLLALPALGTYVKTTLPNVGSVTDMTIERTAGSMNTGYCQVCRIAGPVNCNNSGNWSELADPITGGIPDTEEESGQDFPVNFLFKTIPFQVDLSNQRNEKSKNPRRYRTATLL